MIMPSPSYPLLFSFVVYYYLHLHWVSSGYLPFVVLPFDLHVSSQSQCIYLLPPNKWFVGLVCVYFFACFFVLGTGIWSHKWSEVKWSEVKWSEVSYGQVLVDKSAMYIRVTLYCGHLIILWLFHLGISCTVCFNFYCGGFILFCNVCVCVCVGFVMCVFVRVL